jgi:hypothetical protein
LDPDAYNSGAFTNLYAYNFRYAYGNEDRDTHQDQYIYFQSDDQPNFYDYSNCDPQRKLDCHLDPHDYRNFDSDPVADGEPHFDAISHFHPDPFVHRVAYSHSDGYASGLFPIFH